MQRRAMTQRRLLVYSYIACATLAIGSLGPWFTGPSSSSGINGDGILTLSGAGLAVLAIWRWTVSRRRLALIVALIAALLCAVVAIYGISDTSPPSGLLMRSLIGTDIHD